MANEHQEKPPWDSEKNSDTNEVQAAEEVYPEGIELFFVVAALMLSVFISNLDIVRSRSYLSPMRIIVPKGFEDQTK
jgi:hypothetical protein